VILKLKKKITSINTASYPHLLRFKCKTKGVILNSWMEKWKKRNEQNVCLGEFSKRNGMTPLPAIHNTKFCLFNLGSQGKNANSFRESSPLTFSLNNQTNNADVSFHSIILYSQDFLVPLPSTTQFSIISVITTQPQPQPQFKTISQLFSLTYSQFACPQNLIPKSNQNPHSSPSRNYHRYKTHKTKTPICLN